MENNLSIEQVFDSQDNNEIHKAKPSFVLTAILIATGLVLITVNGMIPASDGTISTLFILTGIGLLIWGIIYAFFKKTGYKLSRNKERITFQEIYFDVKERDRLINILNSDSVNELEKLKPANIDALKLRVATTPDGSFCYSQVVSYVPYEFINANEARKHTPEEIRIILDLLKKRK
ncbi:MAG: hypothetical protein LBS79_03890 [Tannerella sp.]|jgi:hypothetical protein|nr:hypothetical protein [Tannerella sp.]